MPKFAPAIDIPVFLVVWIAVLGGMHLWVHRSEQDTVPKTKEIPAASDGGDLIEAGSPAKIVGVRNGTYLVAEAE